MLSAYELERLRTIARNQEKLEQILGDAASACRKERRALTADELEKRQAAREQRLQEGFANQRSSSRIANRPPTPDLELDTDDEADSRTVVKRRKLSEKGAAAPRRRTKSEASGDALTDAERAALAGASSWLAEMREYFRFKVSEANLRQVMRVAERLASGAGVTHPKHSGLFRVGRPITMATDFIALRAEANEWLRPEDDAGHGWRLDHPIGKCAIFQRHLSETRRRAGATAPPTPAAHDAPAKRSASRAAAAIEAAAKPARDGERKRARPEAGGEGTAASAAPALRRGRGRAAPLQVGAEIDVPAAVFGVSTRVLSFEGRVTRLNKNGSVDVHFAVDGTTCWFPAADAQRWLR